MSFGYIAQARLGTDLLDYTHRSIYAHFRYRHTHTHTLKNEKTCLELQHRLAERWVALIFCEQCRKTFPASLSESVCRIHILRSSFSDATLRSSVVCTCHMLLFTHAPPSEKKRKIKNLPDHSAPVSEPLPFWCIFKHRALLTKEEHTTQRESFEFRRRECTSRNIANGEQCICTRATEP